MANKFNLGLHEVDIVSYSLTNEDLLELEWECRIEEKTNEKETTGEEKGEPPRKFTVMGLAEAFTDLNKLQVEEGIRGINGNGKSTIKISV